MVLAHRRLSRSAYEKDIIQAGESSLVARADFSLLGLHRPNDQRRVRPKHHELARLAVAGPGRSRRAVTSP